MNSFFIAQLMVRRTIGSVKSFLMLVVFPAVVISGIVGLFGSSSVEPATIYVLNEDGGTLGTVIVNSLREIDLYRVSEIAGGTREELKKAVLTGKAGAAVIVPEHFSETILSGSASQIDLYRKNEQLWNTSLALTIETQTRRLEQTAALIRPNTAAAQANEQLLQQLLSDQNSGGVVIQKERLVSPTSNSYTLVIGLMLMFLMTIVNQSVHGVLEDRGNRTMARMFAAPLRASDIALGNFAGCLLLGTLQLVFILLVTRYALNFDFGLPLGKLFLIMECFLLAALGIASAVAGLVRDSANTGQINNLIVVPTCMLGGCFWPTSMMPDFMQKLSNFTPQKWAIQAIEQASASAGYGLQLCILLLFAAVLLAFGTFVLKPARS
jgi:ABC-2 type transport system permease protein